MGFNFQMNGFRPSWTSGFSAWEDNFDYAHQLCRALNPSCIVELGVHFGDSLRCFAESTSPGCRIIGIDTWEGDIHTGEFTDEVYNTCRDQLKEFPNVTLIRSTFDQARSSVQDKSVQILHIDGLHTYEAVKHDFENWKSAVAPGGVILLHDIMVHHEPFGVWKLWEEIKGKYPTEQISWVHGLGVVFISQGD